MQESQQGCFVPCSPVCAADVAQSSPAAESAPARADSHGSLHASCTESHPARPSSGKTISSGVLIAGVEPDAAINSKLHLVSCPFSEPKQQSQQHCMAEERDGRYGNKAAYRIRPSKSHRLSAPDIAARLVGTRPHEPGVTASIPAKV